MSLDDSAPNGSVLCVLFDGFRLVDVHDPLSKIVPDCRHIVYSFHVQQCLVLMLRSLSSPESQEFRSHPQSIRVSCDFSYLTGAFFSTSFPINIVL